MVPKQAKLRIGTASLARSSSCTTNANSGNIMANRIEHMRKRCIAWLTAATGPDQERAYQAYESAQAENIARIDKLAVEHQAKLEFGPKGRSKRGSLRGAKVAIKLAATKRANGVRGYSA